MGTKAIENNEDYVAYKTSLDTKNIQTETPIIISAGIIKQIIKCIKYDQMHLNLLQIKNLLMI